MTPKIKYTTTTLNGTTLAPKRFQQMGTAFRCLNSIGQFEMAFDDGEWFAMERGKGFQIQDQVIIQPNGSRVLVPAVPFKVVSFRAIAGTGDNLIQFYVAQGMQLDDSSNGPVPTYSVIDGAVSTGVKTYAAGTIRGITIENTGSADILISGDGSNFFAMPAGSIRSFNTSRADDWLGFIQIDSTGSSSFITTQT